jgi:mycoredoxin
MQQVDIYGTDSCEDTQNTIHHLDQEGVPYEYINIDSDPAAADWVKRQNDGKQKTPTVKVGELVMSVPSTGQLDTALRTRGLLS